MGIVQDRQGLLASRRSRGEKSRQAKRAGRSLVGRSSASRRSATRLALGGAIVGTNHRKTNISVRLKGKLVGLHNYIALARYRAVSTENVPIGKVALTFDFKYDGGGMGKGGTITLLANGKKVGEVRVDKTAGFKYSLYEGQDIGEDGGSSVDFDYTPPFKFKGRIEKVTVDLK